MKFPKISGPDFHIESGKVRQMRVPDPSTASIDAGKMVKVQDQSDFGLMILMSERSIAQREIPDRLAVEAAAEWLKRHGVKSPPAAPEE